MAQPFSFPDFDVTKMMADFKLPGMDVEAVMEAQRKNIDALTQANALAAEGFQAVAKRQAELVKTAMEEANAVLRDMMDKTPPDQKAARQAELVKTAFEKAIANAREIAEILAKSNREAADVINKRVTEMLEEFRGGLKK